MTGVKMATENEGKQPQVDTTQNSEAVVATVITSPLKKSGVTKKRLILGGSCVLVTAIVVAGILVGVKFYLDATNDVVKKTFAVVTDAHSGQTVSQDVTTDGYNNVAEYHLVDEDKEVWVTQDFNADIEISKVKTQKDSVCFITPLNASDSTMKYIRNASSSVTAVDEINAYYSLSPNKIKDRAVLGTPGQKLCAGSDAYWMTPSCPADSYQEPAGNGTLTRNKRLAFTCQLKIYYVCWKGWWPSICSKIIWKVQYCVGSCNSQFDVCKFLCNLLGLGIFCAVL